MPTSPALEELVLRALPYVGGLAGLAVIKGLWSVWAEWRVVKAAESVRRDEEAQTRILRSIDRKLGGRP